MDSSTPPPPHHHPSSPTPPPSPFATQQHPLPLPLSLGTTTPTHSSPLLLSPSPLSKSRTRLADRLEMAAAAEDPAEPSVKRRRCKTRGSQMGAAVASPRNARKPRRPRSEVEIREDNKDMGLVEEVGKPRKRRNSGRPRKEKLNLPHSVLQPSTSSLAPSKLSSLFLFNESLIAIFLIIFLGDFVFRYWRRGWDWFGPYWAAGEWFGYVERCIKINLFVWVWVYGSLIFLLYSRTQL